MEPINQVMIVLLIIKDKIKKVQQVVVLFITQFRLYIIQVNLTLEQIFFIFVVAQLLERMDVLF